MKKETILKALDGVAKLCESKGRCSNCGLESYCKHRVVYGAPERFPHFNSNVEISVEEDGQLVLYDMDELFNTLRSICSHTLLCDECNLNEECASTCGFSTIPEYWKL